MLVYREVWYNEEAEDVQASEMAERLVQWLQGQVAEGGAGGLVVGLSGGIDSAVVAVLARRACGDNCLALVMPCHSRPADAADARRVAETVGIPCRQVDLGPVYDAFLGQVSGQVESVRDLARANLKPRLRMLTLYFFANQLNYLVAGTGNRSELEVGYFTKYGDGGVDILPLGNLVKGQVRQLAAYLGIPQEIITKPPSAGLWESQTDEGEMGLTYADLDRYLLTGEAGPAVREKVEAMRRASAHKRRLPPVPEFSPPAGI
ncbi:MAG: NAD+ synthase [Clostridia bacterium]|nr:MAG: NAD+ synthase [Clostridia bacterium]